jgi:hypothetical protein
MRREILFSSTMTNRKKGEAMRTALLLACCVIAFKIDAATPQPSDSQKIILTSPNDGDTLTVGDTVTVQWVCIDDIMYVDIRLSPDGGKTWILINDESIGYNNPVSWQHFKWCIPETIASKTDEFSLAGNETCLFRVENYSPMDRTEISINAKPLTIRASSGVKVPGRHTVKAPAFNLHRMLSQKSPSLEGNAPIRLFDARGRAIHSGRGMASGLIFGVFLDEVRPISGAQKAAYVRQQ